MQVTQLKLTLSEPLHAFLASKASRYGMTMASYVRHLIVADVRDMDMPVFQASKETEEEYTLAKSAEKKGDLAAVSNVSEFLTRL